VACILKNFFGTQTGLFDQALSSGPPFSLMLLICQRQRMHTSLVQPGSCWNRLHRVVDHRPDIAQFDAVGFVNLSQ